MLFVGVNTSPLMVSEISFLDFGYNDPEFPTPTAFPAIRDVDVAVNR